MIPRLKPHLSNSEIQFALKNIPNSVSLFETKFAEKFRARHAIAFPYGRSALWTFFQALGFQNSEVILPAYTCSVVAHAIVLSGNIPRFVDIRLEDFNIDLDLLEAAITPKTRAVIATHLFGYPLDTERITRIVKKAEETYGQKIWIIQDCAHSFDAEKNGQSVAAQPDAALFALNISKQITSIFGGILTTDDDSLASTIRTWRDSHFHQAGFGKTIRRFLYLLAVYPAFFEPLYGLIYTLQFHTSLLNRLTRAYHLDEEIVFPPGFDELMLPIESKVGLAQLSKYESIIQKRRENAAYYYEFLQPKPGWVMPPLVAGATYSHYVIRVPDRGRVMQEVARKGIQLGELIEYCIPEWEKYRQYAKGQGFPNSSLCSRTTINLPIYAGLSENARELIVKTINSIF